MEGEIGPEGKRATDMICCPWEGECIPGGNTDCNYPVMRKIYNSSFNHYREDILSYYHFIDKVQPLVGLAPMGPRPLKLILHSTHT